MQAPRFNVKMHVPRRILESVWEQGQVYGRIGRAIAPYGGTFEYVLMNRETILAQVEADRDFHILERGAIQHPRVLNCGSAYVAPYHYLDPIGTRYLSSIAGLSFDPDQIDAQAALAFQRDLYDAQAVPRKSRYDQPDERLPVPQGCIAVFLQSESHRGVGEAQYVTMRQIIKALLARDDPRQIVVKPHPRDVDFETLGWLGQKARKDTRLQILPANMHDILSAASLVVTINSAVGIEAMIHSRPVITCGQADFHHATEVVRAREDVDAAITRAESRSWPHSAYLYWFFHLNCLSMRAPNLGEDVMRKIRATGYFDSLG
jgi:hypothetical protein